MTDDQEKCLGGFISCQRHWENQILAQKELFQVQMTAINEKTMLARESIEARLHSMNEFRETLKDQASRLTTINQHDALYKLVLETRENVAQLREWQGTYKFDLVALQVDVKPLREFMVSFKSMASQRLVNITLGISIMSVIISLLTLMTKWVK